MALTEIERMERIRDLAGKNVLLLIEIRDAGATRFVDGNEDLPVQWSPEQLAGYRSTVDSRTAEIDQLQKEAVAVEVIEVVR